MCATSCRGKLSVFLWAAPLLAAVLLTSDAGAAGFSGRVIDAGTDEPVRAATVRVVTDGSGTATDDDGSFAFTNVPGGLIEVVVHHVGYRPWRRTMTPAGGVMIRIEPLVLRGQDVIVTANRAVRGESPVAFENLTKADIRRS
ncbi:MAG TPA: carboxypeptidase-like regulatory domain-containing protein, partial [Acidobacteriota bacterium]|nr:carboxypeptidase-like regulatory domain-containing protein [Acidobacteriota bacterium]